MKIVNAGNLNMNNIYLFSYTRGLLHNCSYFCEITLLNM